MKNSFVTKGVCSTKINYEVENGIVKELEFEKGCSGNLKGISSLCIGMKVEDVISKLEGITCGPKGTSCPDQLSKALKEVI